MTDTEPLSTDKASDVREEYELIYAEPDPRAYFRVLHGLDYRIPELAGPVFRNVIQSAAEARGARARVLDLGCGFGINAALLRYRLDMNRLAHRFRDLDASDILPDRVVELDRNYFASWPRTLDADFVGLDVSPTPVDYARAVGLLDYGFTRDLEVEDLNLDEIATLRDINCVISTGCVSYAREATFNKLLDAIDGHQPWFAIFVLRTEPFDAIRDCFDAHGLVTERLEGVTFIQRRYHSASEWTQALLTLETAGVATEGKEADGLMHAELYLVRPPSDAEAYPLENVISVSSGTEGMFGGWRGRPWGT